MITPPTSLNIWRVLFALFICFSIVGREIFILCWVGSSSSRRPRKELHAADEAAAEEKAFHRAERDLRGAAKVHFAEKRGERLHAKLRIGKRARDQLETAAEQIAADERQNNCRLHERIRFAIVDLRKFYRYCRRRQERF